MRPFFWRIVICVVPVLLSLAAIWSAYVNDTFKLGVDLSGGTILVYEVDTRKQLADERSSYNPKQDTNLLAESLKRRIDPNDLYNVTIRPAGGEGRVEIILPTGGVRKAEKAQQQWNELLADMQKKYDLENLDVPRGKTQELALRIQQMLQQRIWSKELFTSRESLKELAQKARDFKPLSDELYHIADIDLATTTVALHSPALVFAVSNYQTSPLRAKAIQFDPTAPVTAPGARPQVTTLEGMVRRVKDLVNDYSREKEIGYWFKQQAWNRLLDKIAQHWDIFNPEKMREKYKNDKDKTKAEVEAEQAKLRFEALKNVEPDAVEELIGRVEMKGNTIGQAFMSTLEGVLGKDFVGEQGSDDFLPRTEVADFIRDHYGPSLESIEKTIEESNKASGRQRDLTVEEVQRIKDLVSKVGSLEFRILANQNDDRAAIEDAKNLFKLAKDNNKLKAELDNDQLKGLPPPGPRTGGATGDPKPYTIKLARGETSTVTYSWVELGKQERLQLHLNNLAKSEPGRSGNWAEMAAARAGTYATQLKLPGSGGERFWLNGALFFSRNCEDRNLPEEERRQKQVEYFVLTRNPEINPATGKEKKIDGKYLVSAVNMPGSDGRPAVSFTFNNEGGALFGELTGKNVPSAGTTGDDTSNKRHLAIILDGLVMSAPTINSQITTHGQISGSFTSKEVDELVNILRAGRCRQRSSRNR